MDKLRKNVRKTSKEKSFFPDEIVTNILMRLPVKTVIRSGLVCRRWEAIISARDFVDLHLKSRTPMILVKTRKNFSRPDLFVLDKWWEFARTRLTIHRFPFYSSDFPYLSYDLFSVAGLIVLKVYPPKFFILNPARPSRDCERVQITLCEEFRRSKLCAVYYHPSLKQYVSLWRIDVTGPLGPNPIQYKLLNLGSNPCLKAIKNPFNYKLKDEYGNPLFMNNYLYWMLESEQEYEYGGRNDILEFDIISEEFMIIPCPVPFNTKCIRRQTHLLNCDGILSFLLIIPSTITIWRLEDHAEQLWTTREYTISIIEILDGIISVVDGILAYHCNERLFICNLKEGTVKNYPKRKYSKSIVWFFSHQLSLASLKDCKSALHINKDGEVLV